LEELRDFNRKIQEESWYWRQEQMSWRKIFPSTKTPSFTMREELDKSILQLLQLGDKFIELDNWQEERFIEVTSHLYQDLEVKEEALKKLEAIVQETKQAPSIATAEASTMTKENMVNTPSKTLGDFEKHTRGIGSNIMRKMGYDGQYKKEGQGILIPNCSSTEAQA
jgi:hypothetical protein